MPFERFNPERPARNLTPLERPALSIQRGGQCYLNRQAAALFYPARYVGLLYDRAAHALAFDKDATFQTGVPIRYDFAYWRDDQRLPNSASISISRVFDAFGLAFPDLIGWYLMHDEGGLFVANLATRMVRGMRASRPGPAPQEGSPPG